MKNKVLVMLAIVTVAAALVASATMAPYNYAFAKKRYSDDSNAQTSAAANDCPAWLEADNFLSAVQEQANTNCLIDTNMVQDSDGTAISSVPSNTGPTQKFDVDIEIEVQLPDLTVDLPVRTGVDCPTGQGSCIHTVQLEVTNLSDIPINNPFQVDVSTDNGLFHTEIIPSIAGGVTLPLTVDLGPGNNCYNPDCEVTAFVDSSNNIIESDETNNVDVRLDIG